MIKSITLQNFQSHKNTTIDFCNGVNAIVGLSDSGKTAILRAITWVMTNKPTGEAFQSYWGGETIVKLKLTNGVVVTRGRSSSSNYYLIDEVEFKAFGLGVPLEVEQILNFGSINTEKQMDVPFLLGSSPGEVAQVLNRIVDLEGIDLSISFIRKEKMKADGELKIEKLRFTNTCEKFKQFNYLVPMEKDVNVVEKLTQHHKQTNNKINKIHQLLSDIVELQEQIQKADQIIVNEPHIISVQKDYDLLKTNYRRMKALDLLLDQYSEIRETIKSQILIIKSEKIVNECIQLMNGIKSHHLLIKNIDSLLNNVKKEESRKNQNKVIIESLTQKYHKLMPNICPLCEGIPILS